MGTRRKVRSKGNAADESVSDPQHRVVLGPHLGITEAPALYDTLTKAASQGSAVTLDGSSVDRIHTPAMQLLKAFMEDAEKAPFHLGSRPQTR